jgi:hypothetical protein
MASPNMIALNESIPKPTAVMVKVGVVNEKKHQSLAFKRQVRGNSSGKHNQLKEAMKSGYQG